jgi:uncharacterized membrane protein
MSPVPARAQAAFRQRLGAFFLRGLAAVLPAALTVLLFAALFDFLSVYVTGPINAAIHGALECNRAGWSVLAAAGVEPLDPRFVDIDALPPELRAVGERSGYASAEFARELERERAGDLGFFVDRRALLIDGELLRRAVRGAVPPWIGLVLSLVLVLWIGWLVSGFVGRRLMARVDEALHFIPGIRAVYPYSKQLVDFFFARDAGQRLEFKKVVAVPYPSPAIWSLAFVTNDAPPAVESAAGTELVTVFVPSSPMPMTGYTIWVARASVRELPMSVDDALKVIVSGGVILPGEPAVAGPALRA